MRPQKVQDEVMLKGLLAIMRSKGYDGASLSELAEASGLKKASLYHRFPNGKKEMACAVLNYLNNWIDTSILQILHSKDIEPKKRLKQVIRNIDTLYRGGEEVCLFRSFLMGAGKELFGDQIKVAMENWVSSFTQLGTDLGLRKTLAKKLALQITIELQGSLVVAKGLKNVNIFKSTLKNIEKQYLEICQTPKDENKKLAIKS